MDERVLPRRKRKLYHVFYGMKARCYNKRCPSYYKYGARGIYICEEWLNNYEVFENWAYSHGYNTSLTIDRIDSSRGYSPDNCRWISLSENSGRANIGIHKNKSKLINPCAVTPDGEIIEIENILSFSKLYNLNYSSVVAALHGRISYISSGFIFTSNKTT